MWPSVLPAISSLSLRETQKIVLDVRSFSIYAGTISGPPSPSLPHFILCAAAHTSANVPLCMHITTGNPLHACMAPCAVLKFALCLDEVLALHTFRLDSCSKALLHPMCCAVPSALCRLVCHNWASAPWAPVLRTIQNCSFYFLGVLANNSARFPIYVAVSYTHLTLPTICSV